MAINQMDELIKVFPMRLRKLLFGVAWYGDGLEEIRFRVNQPLLFLYGGEKKYLVNELCYIQQKCAGNMNLMEENKHNHYALSTSLEHAFCPDADDMQEMLMYLCEYSKYAYAKQLERGYLSLDGGIRVGVAGEKIEETGGISHPMFFNIRIPSERKGCADDIVPWIVEDGQLKHTVMIAPPGAGKTTLLREIVRMLSQETWCRSVALVDERYELAASHMGVPQNDVGCYCDVYSGYDKAEGCMQAIRTMGPQVLAVDEIGGQADGEILAYAMRCGVAILASMHAGSFAEFRELWEGNQTLHSLHFQRFLWIEKQGDGARRCQIYDEKGEELCTKWLV